MTEHVLAILGVTASGKSQLAMALADQVPAIELVSVDSMQVYREMDIGTAKPSAADQAAVRHHMIDLVPPSDDYTLSAFQAQARDSITDIRERGGVPVLVGGTGLHLRSVVDDFEIPQQYPEVVAQLETETTEALHQRLAELDPLAANRMEPNNRRRVMRAMEVTVGSGRPFSQFGPGMHAYPPTPYVMVGLRWDRLAINRRIEQRYQQQMEQGFLAEVEALARRTPPISRTAGQALGYRQLLQYVESGGSLDLALERAVVATRKFARRQERWFRRDPRIEWLDVSENPMEVFPQLVGHFERTSC